MDAAAGAQSGGLHELLAWLNDSGPYALVVLFVVYGLWYTPRAVRELLARYDATLAKVDLQREQQAQNVASLIAEMRATNERMLATFTQTSNEDRKTCVDLAMATRQELLAAINRVADRVKG